MRLDSLHAARELKHTFNVVDRKLFGNKVRNGEGVQRFCVFEGNKDIRAHYHLLLDVPEKASVEQLVGLIILAWQRTLWGYEVVDFMPCDGGWVDYITKLDSKPDFASSIDWENFHARVPTTST